MTPTRRPRTPVLAVLAVLAAALVAGAPTAPAAGAAGALPSAARASHAARRSDAARPSHAGRAASYVSAPDLHPPVLTIDTRKPTRARGLVFLDPFASGAKPIVGQPGALILDGQGNPVWFHPVKAGEEVTDFRAQRYLGKPVLTWWQGHIAILPKYTNIPEGSPEPGARFYVYDDHYRHIKTISAQGGWTPDLHELLLTPRGTALFIATKTVSANLAPYGGPADGEIEDAAVQEVNLRTNKLVFQWDMLDHVPLSEAQTVPPPKGIWDPYHTNSVYEDGPHRLLVSARNTWAIYDLERASGKVLWQLGGKGSTFTVPANARFSWQHDAQPLPGGEVSVFDDACCNILPTGRLAPPEGPARGLVLKLDSKTHSASLVHAYGHRPPLYVPSQGNLQPLPTGNVFVGWGQAPYYSEYAASGKLLYDAELPEADESYRAFRLPWRGMPLTKPSVVARRARSRTSVFVSWNGATQVKYWQVFAGATKQSVAASERASKIIAFAPRAGFQTRIPVSVSGPFFQVQALSARNHVLALSPVVHVQSGTPRPRGKPKSAY